MISKLEREQIKSLLQSPQWQAVELVANRLKDKISNEANVGDSEWETVRNTLLNEGQKRGINRLMQELYDIVQNNK